MGEHDQLLPPVAPRSVASLIEGADFVSMLVCGHSCYFEGAESFNRTVAEFVGKNVPALH